MIQSKKKRRLQCTGGSYPRIMGKKYFFFFFYETIIKALSQIQVHEQKMPTKL